MADEPEAEVDYSVHHVAPELQPGDKCAIMPGDRTATVMFIGPVASMPPGYWVGVQYEERVGKNDGTLNGRRYFTCPPGHGGFLRATRINKIEIAHEQQHAKEQEEAQRAVMEEARRKQKKGTPGKGGKSSRLEEEEDKHMDQATEDEQASTGAADIPKDTDGFERPTSPTTSPTASARLHRSYSWRAGSARMHTARSARERDPSLPNPLNTTVSGSGLSSAVVGSLAQFIITAYDGNGERMTRGGGNFTISMRGRGNMPASQPSYVRTKLTDRGDGTYMCEYRPYMTGAYSVDITLDDEPIKGSPFALSVITLRPDASQCVVRGNALRNAIARNSHKFEVLFVDAIGHTAHAEELDLYVEPISEEEAVAMQAQKGQQGKQVTGGGSPQSSSPKPEASTKEQDGSAESGQGASDAALSGSSPSAEHVGGPGEESVDVAATDMGGPKVIDMASGGPSRYKYKKVDASTRQRHMQLWATRQAADKWLARRASEAAFRASGYGGHEGGGGKKTAKVEHVLPSFAHELAADKYGFAFGGVDPGTLHAHGKLIKVHHVSYSVGLAGRYKLHVGLRNQGMSLPGSPFDLNVVPGNAYAATTKLPANKLLLDGEASEAWQQGLVLRTADMLGNLCIQGGAKLTVSLSKKFLQHSHETGEYDVHNPPVQAKFGDNSDGTYNLEWCSTIAGTFPLDVCIDGAHVQGSPISVSVRAADPDVNRFVASGMGLSKAIAGVEAPIRIRVADCFDNTADAGESTSICFGLTLSLVSGGQVGDKKRNAITDGTSKAGKKPGAAGAPPGDGKKGGAAAPMSADAANKASAAKHQKEQMAMESLPFDGKWVGGMYEIRYIAQTAGQLELHLWCENKGSERQPLPGSPFAIHVSEGAANAIGSWVREPEASKVSGKEGNGITAGEHVVLRPQVHDVFGNATSAPEGALTAYHDEPGNEGVPLEPPKPVRSSSVNQGSYELTIEPVKSGLHAVHILLDGVEITGSPVTLNVNPAQPNPQKCYLSPVRTEPTLINQPCDILLKTHDKYGNQLDRGMVRVDAKAAGVAASACTVEDHRDGTYTIRLTAGAPGEVKVTARIDSVELRPVSVFFVREKEGADKDSKGATSQMAEEEDGPIEGAQDAAVAVDSHLSAVESAEMPASVPEEETESSVEPSVAPKEKEQKKKGKKGKGTAAAPAAAESADDATVKKRRSSTPPLDDDDAASNALEGAASPASAPAPAPAKKSDKSGGKKSAKGKKKAKEEA